jgi:hypothetical protein
MISCMPFPSSSRISLACFSRCRGISILWFKGLMRISQSCDSSSGIKSCQAVWIIQDFLICFYNIFNASISEIDKGIEILFLTSLEPSYRLSTTKLHFKKKIWVPKYASMSQSSAYIFLVLLTPLSLASTNTTNSTLILLSNMTLSQNITSP